MPPAAVRTLNDLVYWQYAKIIVDSAMMGKRQRPFVIWIGEHGLRHFHASSLQAECIYISITLLKNNSKNLINC